MPTVNGRPPNFTGTYSGTLVVRQSGGVAGTDEIQFSHDGTNATVETKDGQLQLIAAGTYVAVRNYLAVRDGTGKYLFEVITTSGPIVLSVGLYGWSSHATDLNSGVPDTCLFRVAAGVVAPGGAAAVNPGWIQNTAGRAIKAANQTVTDSATLVNDTHFQFTLIAGRKYSFKGHYHVTTVATSGVKIDFAGGAATATSFDVMVKFLTAAAVAVTTATAIATAHGSTAAVLVVEFEGTIVVNAGGTFIVRFAQNAETGAAESVVARLGSWMMLEDMP